MAASSEFSTVKLSGYSYKKLWPIKMGLGGSQKGSTFLSN
jgi:hypothetical protein